MADPYDIICQKFTLKCYSYDHKSCRQVQVLINNELNKGNICDNDFLNKFISFLTKSGYQNCIEKTEISNILIKICKYIKPTESNILDIMKNDQVRNTSTTLLKYLLENNKLSITDKIIDSAIENGLFEVLKLFLSKKEFNSSSINKLCSKAGPTGEANSILNSILNHKIELEEDMLIILIKNKNEDMASEFIKLGCPVTKLSLDAACESLSKNIILQIIKFDNIIPDKISYDSLFTFFDRPYTYKKNGMCVDAPLIAEIIDILVDNGYIIKYDDVLLALKNRCYINAIERFNINFTSDFIDECANQSYYPYDNINLKPTMESLYIECSKINNLPTIKKLVKSGLKPDIVCLRNACNSRSNKPIIKYLMETHKLTPDIECIKNISKNIKCPNLDLILNYWDKNEEPVDKDKLSKSKKSLFDISDDKQYNNLDLNNLAEELDILD